MRAHLALLGLLVLTNCAKTSAHSAATQEPLRIRIDARETYQTIEGFGTTAAEEPSEQPWYRTLYYDDLRASILRVDVTPTFQAEYAAYHYNSPWFHNAPKLPGPAGDNVRRYRDAADYTREWSGRRARIAVMGPDLEQNLKHFDFAAPGTRARGALARLGFAKREELGDFKLIGSVWSPAPWLKQSSGSRYAGAGELMPKPGTPFPFIWAGNFAGGLLDTSDKPLAIFDDRALGGAGPTSALTQFARGLAAYLLGFQRSFEVRFHAISIQNELNFETFYNSCSYPRAEHYAAALKAARRELDRHPELAHIRIMGPEDLLGGDGYALWQYGRADGVVHKNLQYLAALSRDPEAQRSLDFFAIHGYAPDGVSAVGQDPWAWRAWAEGWKKSPGDGLPERVRGFTHFGKSSWMTETSGESMRWAPDAAVPLENSAVGLALKIHQALTVGRQSAWLYWQLVGPNEREGLTDEVMRERSPKYAAARHFFRFIRPGARRIAVHAPADAPIQASGYLHDDGSTVVVLINPSDEARALLIEGWPKEHGRTEGQLSHARALFVAVDAAAISHGQLTLPPHSVATLVTSPR